MPTFGYCYIKVKSIKTASYLNRLAQRLSWQDMVKLILLKKQTKETWQEGWTTQ